MNKHLSLIGISFTLFYLLLIGVAVCYRFSSLLVLPLNELGDFLAGAFGPLAIFWLILGFFQQGVELRQNTAALELQAEELRNSVEQQRELVSITREQFKADLEAIRQEKEGQRKALQPHIVSHGIGASHRGTQHTYTLNVRNVGNTATDVQIIFNVDMKRVAPNKIPSWLNGQDIRIEFEYSNWEPAENSLLLIVYRDKSGVPGEISFPLSVNRNGAHPMVEIDAS